MRESETIEHKKSLAELSEGLVSIAAILNKHGHGELWFGVRNDGAAVGMDVAETTLLQRIHLIEAWGRGLSLILSNAPNARFEQVGSILITTFPRHQQPEPEARVTEKGQASADPDTQVGEQVGEQVANILRRCASQPQSKRVLLEAAGFSNAYLNYKRHLLPLIQDGLLERTLADKPNSRLQKYRLTDKGRALLIPRP